MACFCWMAHACVANHLVAPSVATSGVDRSFWARCTSEKGIGCKFPVARFLPGLGTGSFLAGAAKFNGQWSSRRAVMVLTRKRSRITAIASAAHLQCSCHPSMRHS